MKVQPLSNHVFIEPITKESSTKSGIVLPETSSGEKPMMGKVIAVGAGKIQDGKLIPMTVKAGQTVLFKKYGPDEIEIDGKKLLVGDEDDVLAIVSE